ncbi:hypothetical protein F4777DRAFT_569624 [Nemania sp. FL0916]|nr:hypothetical protein F4777DRAFT_569624 [Nemania sp. FL0916]
MQWIHRSAFEFFSDLQDKNPMLRFNLSREELLQQIGNSLINCTMAAPSCICQSFFREQFSLTVIRLQYIKDFIADWYNDYPAKASALLDKMHGIHSHLDHEELVFVDSWNVIDEETIKKIAEKNRVGLFWYQCNHENLHPYILSRTSLILKDPGGDVFLASRLVYCFYLRCQKTGSKFLVSNESLDGLGTALQQHTLRTFKMNGATETTKYKCVRPVITAPAFGEWSGVWIHLFSYATWKEPDAGVPAAVTAGLIRILRTLWMWNGWLGDTPLQMPESISNLMDRMTLYVAPNIAFRCLYIQISAKALVLASYDLERRRASGDPCLQGSIGRHISASHVHRAVQIVCVPSMGVSPEVPQSLGEAIYLSVRPLEKTMEPTSFNHIFLHPSIATSDRLLRCLGYEQASPESRLITQFTIIPHTQESWEEMYEMLLQDINSTEQGLDESQRMIAADCVRAAFMDPSSSDYLSSGRGGIQCSAASDDIT